MNTNTEVRVHQFIAAVQAKTTTHSLRNFKNLIPDVITAPTPWGAKYIRIVRSDSNGGSASVHCFIDRSNGDILKAAGWKAPAKHARGNIFADDLGMSCMDPYGPKSKARKSIARLLNSMTVWSKIADDLLEERKMDEYFSAKNARDDAMIALYYEHGIELSNTRAAIANVPKRKIAA